MKRYLLLLALLLVAISLFACTSQIPANPATTTTPSHTTDQQPLETAQPSLTPLPTITPTETATPTPLVLPVSIGTPLPALEVITTENYQRLTQIALYLPNEDPKAIVRESSDGTKTLIAAPYGYYLFDTESKTLLTQINHLLPATHYALGYVMPGAIQIDVAGDRFLVNSSGSNSVFDSAGNELYAISNDRNAALSPDGRYLAVEFCSSGCDSDYLQSVQREPFFIVVEIDTGNQIYSYNSGVGGEMRGSIIGYTSDGLYLLTKNNLEIIVWDAISFDRVMSFSGKSWNLLPVLSGSGKKLAIIDHLETNIYDLETRKVIRSFQTRCEEDTLRYRGRDAIFSADETWIAVNNCPGLRIVNLDDGQIRDDYSIDRSYALPSLSSFTLTNEGTLYKKDLPFWEGRIMSGWINGDRPEELFFMEQENASVASFTNSYSACQAVAAVDSCQKGEFLLDNKNRLHRVVRDGKQVSVLGDDREDSEILMSFACPAKDCKIIAFNVDQNLLFYNILYSESISKKYWLTATSGTGVISEIKDGTLTTRQQFEGNPLISVRFSPDGKNAMVLMGRDSGNKLIIYDLEEQKALFTTSPYPALIGADGLFGDDNQLFVYNTVDQGKSLLTIHFRSISSPDQEITHNINVHEMHWYSMGLASSPGGELMAYTENGQKIGLMKMDGTPLITMDIFFPGNEINWNFITDIGFSPDGKQLVIINDDSKIAIFGVLPVE